MAKMITLSLYHETIILSPCLSSFLAFRVRDTWIHHCQFMKIPSSFFLFWFLVKSVRMLQNSRNIERLILEFSYVLDKLKLELSPTLRLDYMLVHWRFRLLIYWVFFIKIITIIIEFLYFWIIKLVSIDILDRTFIQFGVIHMLILILSYIILVYL